MPRFIVISVVRILMFHRYYFTPTRRWTLLSNRVIRHFLVPKINGFRRKGIIFLFLVLKQLLRDIIFRSHVVVIRFFNTPIIFMVVPTYTLYRQTFFLPQSSRSRYLLNLKSRSRTRHFLRYYSFAHVHT